MNKQELTQDVEAIRANFAELQWVGVDFDGCLGKWEGWDPGLGQPVPEMVRIIKDHLAAGDRVKVLTARAWGELGPHFVKTIGDWTEKHIGQRLEVTNEKDPYMTRFYDDRCIQVIPNIGVPVMAVPGVYELVQRYTQNYKREELKRKIREAVA